MCESTVFESGKSYDANSNMIKRTGSEGTVTQTYDTLNRLISWEDEEKKGIYQYNFDDLRIRKEVDGEATNHIWVNGEIQLDKTEEEVISYTHGLKLVESGYGWYLYNGHQDVVQLVLEGTVVARNDCDAYGMARNKHQQEQDKTDPNSYRYAGEYQDKESGYLYLRARYYDPKLGRFINEDPIRDGDNWQVYGNGNPVKYSDPSGTELVLAICALVAIVTLSDLARSVEEYFYGDDTRRLIFIERYFMVISCL